MEAERTGNGATRSRLDRREEEGKVQVGVGDASRGEQKKPSTWFRTQNRFGPGEYGLEPG